MADFEAGGLRVDLEAFQGPLDLLLHLVQQAEVEIQELPLARIADQFVKYLESGISSLDVDKAIQDASADCPVNLAVDVVETMQFVP